MHRSKVVGEEGRRLRSISGLHPLIGLQPPAMLIVAAPGRPGFAGTCETTLTDWIQLIQMGRRDAVVSLVTHDGKVGTLWCRGGDIIDAACDGLVGEDAVYRALTWVGGRVSVDFAGFSHHRAILTATAGLLLGAAYRKDSAVHDAEQPQTLAALPDDPATTTHTAIAASPAPARRTAHRSPVLVLGIAGGIVALSLAVGLISNRRIPGRPQNTMATKSAHDLFGPTSAVAAPGHAAIALPTEQVDVGQSEVFAGALEAVRGLAPAQPMIANAVRKHRRVAKVPAVRNVATTAALNRPPLESAIASLRVQIIEEQPPRIQIIGDGRSEAHVLE